MKRRDLVKLLENAGYTFDRNNGHSIYEKIDRPPIQIPNHREINEKLAKKILKDAGLI